jgi:hypothetical protein
MTPREPSEDFYSVHTHRDGCTAAFFGSECDCPGPPRYVAVDVIEGLLPKVYDGMHLTDCPYVDVLMRIREVVAAGQNERG